MDLVGCLWKEHFKDPSQCWSNQSTQSKALYHPHLELCKNQSNPLSPDDKFCKESPSWLQLELRRGRLQPFVRSREIHYGELCAGSIKKTNKTRMVQSNSQAEDEDDLSNSRIGNHQKFQEDTCSPVALVALLKACAKESDIHKGSRIHAVIVKMGFLENNIYLGSALVNMYAKCGALAKAQEVFDELPSRNVISWNGLIAGYAQHGRGSEAIDCFLRMKFDGLSPTAVTFSCILKACGTVRALDKGQEVHAEIVREGLLGKDIVVGNALVDMYAKCGALLKAQQVFEELPVRDVVSWTALIAGYSQSGSGNEAISRFEQMQLEGLSPNPVTLLCILNACGHIGAFDKGQEVHAEIVRHGLLGNDPVIGNALVDMYAKLGKLAKAQEVFDKLLLRNVVSWNALIAGYAQHGYGEEAIDRFQLMQLEGLPPSAVTFTCILKACGSIGAMYKGQEIHGMIVKEGLLEENDVIGNAMVVMYAKCGALLKAQEVFDELLVQDIVSWNAIIAGYAQLGKDVIVFDLFKEMVGEGKQPDLATFIILLNACSHSGLLNEGQIQFENMSTGYNIIPNVEHHICVVDLFGRAGHLDKALAVIKDMPYSANLTVWHTLLGACRKWGNVKLGTLAFQHAVQMDEKEAATYVGMSNIYTSAGMREDLEKIKAMRVEKQAWKRPHFWWTDDSGLVY